MLSDVLPLLNCICMMARAGIAHSVNYREQCILYWQCTVSPGKQTECLSSQTYFKQIIFCLKPGVFAKSYKKLYNFVTILSLVTLQGSVCTRHVKWIVLMYTVQHSLLQLHAKSNGNM